jgi:hypothetical protein
VGFGLTRRYPAAEGFGFPAIESRPTDAKVESDLDVIIAGFMARLQLIHEANQIRIRELAVRSATVGVIGKLEHRIPRFASLQEFTLCKALRVPPITKGIRREGSLVPRRPRDGLLL